MANVASDNQRTPDQQMTVESQGDVPRGTRVNLAKSNKEAAVVVQELTINCAEPPQFRRDLIHLVL